MANVSTVLEVDFPSGTKRYGPTGMGTTGYAYEPRCLEGTWQSLRRGVEVLGTNLPLLSTNVELANTDKAIERLLEGSSDPRRAPVRVYYATEGLARSSWSLRFTGILDSWEYRPGRVRLSLTTDVAPLEGFLPRIPLLKSDWPNLPATNVGYYLPYVFGTHNSTGLSGTGMLPGICLDWVAATSGWYTPGYGSMKSIKAVYVNGVAKTLTTHYTVTAAYTRSGKQLTLVQFTAGNIPASGDTITMDVDGYETSADGTGTLESNPVAQLRRLLGQFVYQDYRSGAWLTTSSVPVDNTSFGLAETWCSQQQLEGSGYVGSGTQQIRAMDAVNAWLATFEPLKLYWDEYGRLAMGILDISDPDYPTTASAWVRPYHEVEDSLTVTYDTSQLARQVSATYLYGQASGQPFATIDVQDLNVTEKATLNLQAVWSASRAV